MLFQLRGSLDDAFMVLVFFVANLNYGYNQYFHILHLSLSSLPERVIYDTILMSHSQYSQSQTGESPVKDKNCESRS